MQQRKILLMLLPLLIADLLCTLNIHCGNFRYCVSHYPSVVLHFYGVEMCGHVNDTSEIVLPTLKKILKCLKHAMKGSIFNNGAY